MNEISGTIVAEQEADAAAPSLASVKRALNQGEARYMRGDQEPAVSSVLISNSKYLNNPYYRDTFAQFALRRHDWDLPETYLIPDMVRALAEVRDNAEFYALLMAEKATKPELATWLDARADPRYDPAEMRHYKPGTLGATVRDFIELSGMEMQFMKKDVHPGNDLEYMLKRRAQTHDIEHMVTGFGPNQLGESALAIMNTTATAAYFTPELARYCSEATMFVSATGWYRVSLHYPRLLPAELEAMRRGIEAGQAIGKPLFLVDWDSYFDWPVEEIAPHLGFQRGPGDEWAWSLQASRG